MDRRVMLALAVAATLSLAYLPCAVAVGQEKESEHDRNAKAAFAFAAASHPDKCQCAKGKVLSWQQGCAKSVFDRAPLVVFAGGAEPRCCGNAVAVKMTLIEAKAQPEKPIVVYIPAEDGKTMIPVDWLPGDADAATIKKAVESARKKIAGEKPPV